MSAEENIAVVVLAAGGSTRLGRPKQLVEFNGKHLLDHALDKVDLLGFQTKILVLGAKREEIMDKIDSNGFKVVVNTHWEQGMASSIKVGLEAAMAEEEGLDQIFIAAGLQWREPGCSMCLAMNADQLGEGKHCASTSNRNFEGRQGFGGRTHLVSPAMAAAAAIAGHFVDIRKL